MSGDSETNIQTIKQKVKKFNDERYWDQYHHPKELAISLNLEAAELLELFQWSEKQDINKIKKDKKLVNNISRELAEILIYSANFANKLDIDLSKAVFDKLTENEIKYPVELVKGKSKKYSEYGGIE